MKLELRWRILALLALVGYGAIAVALLLLALRSPVLLVLWTLTTLGVLYGAWLVFSGEGQRHKRGVVLLIVLAIFWVAELVLIAREPGNIRTIVGIGVVSVVYTLIVSILRKQYWKSLRRSNTMAKSTASFKKPYLVINPKSGGGRATKSHLADHARKLGITAIVLNKGDDVEALARKAVNEGADVLGVSGGDGSIGAVAKVAIEHDLPIVVLAGGTRCHFARDLGLNPKEINDGLAGFSGVERRVDVGEINGRIFLNNASFGMYADIVDSPDYRDNKLAVSRAVLKDLASGKKPGYKLSFAHNGTKYTNAVQILVGVNQYKTISLLDLGERDQLDEGALQVTVITKLTDELVKQLLKVFSIDFSGGVDRAEGVEQWNTKEFKVTDGSKLVVGVDGEREEYSSPVVIQVKPKALRIYVPAEGKRSRPKKAASLGLVRRLWQAVMGAEVR
jgi:diacylglycerol kinase family enzyme